MELKETPGKTGETQKRGEPESGVAVGESKNTGKVRRTTGKSGVHRKKKEF